MKEKMELLRVSIKRNPRQPNGISCLETKQIVRLSRLKTLNDALVTAYLDSAVQLRPVVENPPEFEVQRYSTMYAVPKRDLENNYSTVQKQELLTPTNKKVKVLQQFYDVSAKHPSNQETGWCQKCAVCDVSSGPQR